MPPLTSSPKGNCKPPLSIWNPHPFSRPIWEPGRPTWGVPPPMAVHYPVGQRPEGVLESCPVETYKLGEKGSRAYRALTYDWQCLIAQVIDDVHREAFETDEKFEIKKAKEAEGQRLLGFLSTLKYESGHNKAIEKIEDVGDNNQDYWDHWFKNLPDGARWFDLTYHVAESYLHKRIHTLFRSTLRWAQYDPYRRRKLKNLQDDSAAIYQLTKPYRDFLSSTKSKPLTEVETEETFTSLCKLALFPSPQTTNILAKVLLRPRNNDQVTLTNPAFYDLNRKIILDHTSQAYIHLKDIQSVNKNSHIRIFLSKAGFPLLTDLILVLFLLEYDLAKTVTLHTMAFPFSDHCTNADVPALVTHLRLLAKPYTDKEIDSPFLNEAAAVDWFVEQLTHAIDDKSINICNSPAFSFPVPYWHMHHYDKNLYSCLSETALVIVKGDYHYRKLVCDGKWPTASTSLATALGPLGPESKLSWLTLRPIESDVLVDCAEDVQKKVEDTAGAEARRGYVRAEEQEKGEAKGRAEWSWGGKWGSMQFSGGS